MLNEQKKSAVDMKDWISEKFGTPRTFQELKNSSLVMKRAILITYEWKTYPKSAFHAIGVSIILFYRMSCSGCFRMYVISQAYLLIFFLNVGVGLH